MMNRLDKVIADVSYVLDSLMAYRNIIKSGDCNRCMKKTVCIHAPKPGQQVRYNCPFYEEDE